MNQRPLNKKLVSALSNLLVIANHKLDRAKQTNNTWSINHYEQDIAFIKTQLKK
jgi:hypothetical protein